VNRDVAKGKVKQLRGAIKQKWGQLTDDDLAIAEGDIQRLVGDRALVACSGLRMILGPSLDQKVNMKTKLGITMLVPVLLLALTIAPAFAQDSTNSSNPSTQSMPNADQSAPQAAQPAPPAAQSGIGAAASSTAKAVENMGHEAATKIKDTTITAKVKAALLDDKDVGNNTIHVSTTAGVVTLKGEVRDEESSKRATELAQQTVGVKSVTNRLTVINSGAMR
jgi:hyperosmotically inducible periplasmic protein